MRKQTQLSKKRGRKRERERERENMVKTQNE